MVEDDDDNDMVLPKTLSDRTHTLSTSTTPFTSHLI